MNKTDEKYLGIGDLALVLTAIFVLLKCTHVITWSWLWVFAPLWITVGVVILLLFLCVQIMCVAAILESKNNED